MGPTNAARTSRAMGTVAFSPAGRLDELENPSPEVAFVLWLPEDDLVNPLQLRQREVPGQESEGYGGAAQRHFQALQRHVEDRPVVESQLGDFLNAEPVDPSRVRTRPDVALVPR